MNQFEYYEPKLEPTHYADECPVCGALIDCSSKSAFHYHVQMCMLDNAQEPDDDNSDQYTKTNSNSQSS